MRAVTRSRCCEPAPRHTTPGDESGRAGLRPYLDGQPDRMEGGVAIILLLFVTIIAVDQLSAWLRKKLVGEQAFAFGRGD